MSQEPVQKEQEMPSLVGVIWMSPDRVSGVPCFYGTRVPVQNLFDYLEGGESIDDFLEGFPGVTREQVAEILTLARLSFFKQIVQ